MKNGLLFILPGAKEIGRALMQQFNAEEGNAIIRKFPDGETLVKVVSDVYGREVLIVCSLNNPDEKLLPLYLLAKTLKEFGASSVLLIAPYLAYIRQDKSFSFGECISAPLFAQLLSTCVDQLITLQPHFHTGKSLSELYPIHASGVSAAPLIASWVVNNVSKPFLISPDNESSQWVEKMAEDIQVPFMAFNKSRKTDEEVELVLSQMATIDGARTPVIIDDAITTGATMKEAIVTLRKFTAKLPVCIAVHGLFVRGAFEKLMMAGAGKIVTTNTLSHPTNAIGVERLLADEVCKNSFVLY
ncbi:MAG: ribose-phosphate diphosphokinase [Williamsia sp.]|nr:ribose-phosphate diphosphokinase [Williamsia sp.]